VHDEQRVTSYEKRDNMLYTVITVIHVLACLFMIGVVLLQQGKGADMGAVFGGSSQTLFGSSGAGNFLTRTTAAVAAIFMVTSLTLAYGSARRVTTTIFDDAPLAPAAPAPAGEPGAAPAAEGAPAPESAPAAEPQAKVEGVVEGSAGVAVETGKEAAANLADEAKAGGEAVADAAQGAAAEAKAGAEAAAKDIEAAAKTVEQKAEAAADAAVAGEAAEAPGQVDPVPPAAE
jgi:preprotein translocase subunit SecG